MVASAADLEHPRCLRRISWAQSLASLSTSASCSSCLSATQGCGGFSDKEAVGQEEPEELEEACGEGLPDGSQWSPAGAAFAPNAATTPSPCCNGAAERQHSWPTPPSLDGLFAGAAGGARPACVHEPRCCWLAQLLKQPLAVLSRVMSGILPLGSRPAAPRRRRAPTGAGYQADGLDRETEDGGPLCRVRRCHDLPSLAAAAAAVEAEGRKGAAAAAYLRAGVQERRRA